MTLTEKITITLSGKTFEMCAEGDVLIGEGIVLGAIDTNHIQLIATRKEDGREWFEIRHLDECGYDWTRKAGFRFSLDNPHREELES